MAFDQNPTIFLVCTGLGRISRGYETFTRECFEALKNENSFKLFLLKGAGKKNKNEFTIFNIYRKSKPASLLKRLINKDGYWIEQFTFFISMLPLIIIKRPRIIYYSDFILGTFLWHARRFFKFRYKLLFANGAPNGAPFKTEDHIQQLLPVYYNDALQKAEPAHKQTLLPYGFNIDTAKRWEKLNKKDLIKQRLNLDINKKIVLSVGAVNMHHKRMDYFIKEVSCLDENYFLVILGQFESETPHIQEMAKSLLTNRYIIKTVTPEELEDYYAASDYFVLASLNEGFGRVMVEAISFGLMCIVNDTRSAHEVLAESGTYINMEKPGQLSAALRDTPKLNFKADAINDAYNRFSWNSLKQQYVSMLNNVIRYN